MKARNQLSVWFLLGKQKPPHKCPSRPPRLHYGILNLQRKPAASFGNRETRLLNWPRQERTSHSTLLGCSPCYSKPNRSSRVETEEEGKLGRQQIVSAS
jgi:hypothetical protein